MLRIRQNCFSYIKLPYIPIGEELGKQIYQNYLKTKCNIFILGNHGLVVAHDSPIEAEKIHKEFIENVSIKSRDEPIFEEELIKPFLNFSKRFYLPDSDNKLIHSLAIDPISLKLSKSNAPYPDHIVFCGLVNMLLFDNNNLQHILLF